MLVKITKAINFSVDGIHEETLTEGEYIFDELPSIAKEVCVKNEFMIYDPKEKESKVVNSKGKAKKIVP